MRNPANRRAGEKGFRVGKPQGEQPAGKAAGEMTGQESRP